MSGDLFYIINGKIEVQSPLARVRMRIPARQSVTEDGRIMTRVGGGQLGQYVTKVGLNSEAVPLAELRDLGFRQRKSDSDVFVNGDFEILEDKEGNPYIFRREGKNYRFVSTLGGQDENHTL